MSRRGPLAIVVPPFMSLGIKPRTTCLWDPNLFYSDQCLVGTLIIEHGSPFFFLSIYIDGIEV